MSKRRIYSIIGLLAVAWVVLYLSSYGVMVSSEEVSADELQRQMIWLVSPPAPQPSEAQAREAIDLSLLVGSTGLSSVRRCTYFTGTGFYSVNSGSSKQPVCARLWSFGQ